AKALARHKGPKPSGDMNDEPAIPKNREKFVYKIKKGDTIGQLAELFGMRAADIRNWNDISYRENIIAGTNLTLWLQKGDAKRFDQINTMSQEEKQQAFKRSQAVAKADESAQEGSAKYVVKQGDTLDKIARDNGVSVKQLKSWNRLRSTTIILGQELIIHTDAAKLNLSSKKGSEIEKKPQARDHRAIVYVVKKGDTLWDIARAHNVTEAQLKTWNKLTGKTIRIGQELLIYKDGFASRS
ncbi:MAG: LysM peptidoglycan-binding domain-containing protein, partial [Bacteroidota bacterium]